MNERKDAFLEEIVQYSSSGRLRDQDSSPPRKLKQTRMLDPMEEISMRDFLEIQNGRPPASGAAVSDTKRDEVSAMAGFSYIAEHQENIRSIQVLLSGLQAFGPQDMILETGSRVAAEATIRSKDSQVSVVILMPADVVPGQGIALSPSKDAFIEARLESLPRPPDAPSLNVVVHALSASEIRRYRPVILQCVSCGQQVADTKVATESPEGYKDLPSEHWAEMMEVWMCHNDPSWTAKLAKRTEEGFWPTKGRVLVGGSYLQVAAEDIRAEGLKFGDTTNVSFAVCFTLCPFPSPEDYQEGQRHYPLMTRPMPWGSPSQGPSEALASFVGRLDRGCSRDRKSRSSALLCRYKGPRSNPCPGQAYPFQGEISGKGLLLGLQPHLKLRCADWTECGMALSHLRLRRRPR